MRPNGWLAISYLLATIVAQGIHHHGPTGPDRDPSDPPEARQPAHDGHADSGECPSCDARVQAGTAPVAPPPLRPEPAGEPVDRRQPASRAGASPGFLSRAPPTS